MPDLSKSCDNDIPTHTRSMPSKCTHFGREMLRRMPTKQTGSSDSNYGQMGLTNNDRRGRVRVRLND